MRLSPSPVPTPRGREAGAEAEARPGKCLYRWNICRVSNRHAINGPRRVTWASGWRGPAPGNMWPKTPHLQALNLSHTEQSPCSWVLRRFIPGSSPTWGQNSVKQWQVVSCSFVKGTNAPPSIVISENDTSAWKTCRVRKVVGAGLTEGALAGLLDPKFKPDRGPRARPASRPCYCWLCPPAARPGAEGAFILSEGSQPSFQG